MQREGPPLERLTRRLADTPPDFLEEPRIGRAGLVRVDAVVNDLLAAYGVNPEPGDLEPFGPDVPAKDRNRLALVLIGAWLAADTDLAPHVRNGLQVLKALRQVPANLAPHVNPRSLLDDPERREEMVRAFLSALHLRPDGESHAQAEDRLTAVSSAERQRVLKAAREAEERARQVREALARKAAEESADKYMRE